MGTVNSSTEDMITLRDSYTNARKLYTKKNFAAALEIFDELSLKNTDQASTIFSHRCRELIVHPPSEDWTDVFEFEHK